MGFDRAHIAEYVKDNMITYFETENALNAFVADQMARKANNTFQRKKRFKRKANFNSWTHFVTITYDDTKHTEQEFKTRLRKCLSNLHTRRNWRYMGVFERAPETHRLHFHALMYIPENEMIGELQEKKDYSTKQHKVQVTTENTFFAKTFGRNDFATLSKEELKCGNTINYLLKYISKTGEKITYSRGVPENIQLDIFAKDVVCEMQDYVTKYVLFDDVINNDILRNKEKPPAQQRRQ